MFAGMKHQPLDRLTRTPALKIEPAKKGRK